MSTLIKLEMWKKPYRSPLQLPEGSPATATQSRLLTVCYPTSLHVQRRLLPLFIHSMQESTIHSSLLGYLFGSDNTGYI